MWLKWDFIQQGSKCITKVMANSGSASHCQQTYDYDVITNMTFPLQLVHVCECVCVCVCVSERER